MTRALDWKERMLRDRKKVRLHARKRVQNKLKSIADPERAMYQGLFAYNIIWKCARSFSIAPKTLIFILIVDYYEVFKRRDAFMWGFIPSVNKMDIVTREAKEKGFVEVEVSKNGYYYLTFKGRELVKKYSDLFKKTVKDIIADNAHGNPNTNRKPGTPLVDFSKQNNNTTGRKP